MSRTFFDKVQAANILNRLWQRCESEESHDIVLIAGTERKRIPAHRSILSGASDYFDRVLNENTSKEFEIPSLNGVMLQRVIEFCYTGRIVISKDNAVELLKIAHNLFLRKVVTACENCLADQLNPNNCFGFALLAEHYNCEILLEEAKGYCLKELLKMYGTDQFLSLKVEQVSQLLASDELRVASEEEVFNSLVKWIEHDQREREKHKADLLKLVRMSLLEHSFLIKTVRPFCISTESKQIYMDAIESLLLAERSNECKSEKPREQSQYLMAITPGERSSNKMFVQYYCPQRNSWIRWLKALEYRIEYGLAVLEDCLFIVGGYDAGHNVLNTVICLSLKTMTLKKITPMQQPRGNCNAAALNGFLYVVGGFNGKDRLSSVEKFDPKTNKWATVASMSVNRMRFGIATFNDKLFLVGGDGDRKEVGADGYDLRSAEFYDPIQNVWQNIAPMAETHLSPGIAVADGFLYVIGCCYQRSTVERYDPQTDKWTMMCRLRPGINWPSNHCTTFNSNVIVCTVDHIDEYNPATNKWNEIASFSHQPNENIFSYSDKLLTSDFMEN